MTTPGIEKLKRLSAATGGNGYPQKRLAEATRYAHIEGVVPHDYFEAREFPGAFAADHCNRQAVTIEFWWNRVGDFEELPVWKYDLIADDLGLDPWKMIHDVDQSTKGSIFFLGGKWVPANHVVFVQRKDLERWIDSLESKKG